MYFSRTLPLWICICLLFNAACVNLKEVGEFAHTSKTSLANLQTIEYGFAQACRDRCRMDAMEVFRIERSEDCGCQTYQKADSVLLRIQLTINGYFDGMEQLSGNQLTRYNLSGQKRLMQEGVFGEWRISEQETHAYTNLAELIASASTDGFRRRELRRYIEVANQPLLTLLEHMEMILIGNLQTTLDNKKSRLYGYYQKLTYSNNLSDLETGLATKLYYEELDAIHMVEQQIDATIQALQKIAEAHQVLYNERNRINRKDFKAIIKLYQSDISDLIAAFNQIN
jgi:hypothetical protein